jgi:hypothetical protein
VRGIDEDKAEIGFGNSISTVDGVNGAAPFPRKAANVCQLASLYPQDFQIVANEDSGHQFGARPQGQGDRRRSRAATPPRSSRSTSSRRSGSPTTT